jgi:hypothetical protein
VGDVEIADLSAHVEVNLIEIEDLTATKTSPRMWR